MIRDGVGFERKCVSGLKRVRQLSASVLECIFEMDEKEELLALELLALGRNGHVDLAARSMGLGYEREGKHFHKVKEMNKTIAPGLIELDCK